MADQFEWTTIVNTGRKRYKVRTLSTGWGYEANYHTIVFPINIAGVSIGDSLKSFDRCYMKIEAAIDGHKRAVETAKEVLTDDEMEGM